MVKSCVLATAVALFLNATLVAQSVPPPPKPTRPGPAVEKTGAGRYRIGPLHVDTASREVVVPGRLNEITTVEVVANARGGAKAYESAITMNADAVSFNAALLLIGLDPARSKPSKMQFDPVAPEGDPVELLIELPERGKLRRVAVEEILFDQGTKKTLPAGPWVYTGSTFLSSPDGPRFLAELDGVLIGLMHGPSAIIDNPRNDLISRFGRIILNPALAKAGMEVSVIIRALPLSSRPK